MQGKAFSVPPPLRPSDCCPFSPVGWHPFQTLLGGITEGGKEGRMLGACQFKLLAPKTPGERKERGGLLPLPPPFPPVCRNKEEETRVEIGKEYLQ